MDYVFERHSPIGANGLSEVVWRLAEPLAAFGHEVHIAGPYKATELPVVKGIVVHPFEVPSLWYRNIVGHSLIVKKAIETLQQHDPFDVFHAPEYLSTGLFSLLDSTTPLVLTEPGNIYERIANGNPYDFVTTQVYKLMARRTARSRTVIVATSEEMAQWWQRTGSDAGRIARIPLGVDLKDFSPVAEARQQLGWSEKHKHILFVARLSVETGAQYLLEALPAILKQFPQARLHLVGNGLAESSLREMVNRLNLGQAVEWHGWVSLKDLAYYYSAADLMVFPGTSGGTPRVMLQAMSCGTPFVGSAIGGITTTLSMK